MCFVVKKRKPSSSSTSSSIAEISMERLEFILDKLLNHQNRKLTRDNYIRIWHSFNRFLLRLDRKPKFLECRVTLFLMHLIDDGAQSSMIRSYLLAIKSILKADKYKRNDDLVLVTSLTRACKLINDRVMSRLPIQRGLLDVLLHEISRNFKDQFYLRKHALPRVVYPPRWYTCQGVYLPGGVPAWGVYLSGGVPAQGVYLAGGCTCPGGTCPSAKILPCPKLRNKEIKKSYWSEKGKYNE